MAAACGRAPTPDGAQPFSSHCPTGDGILIFSCLTRLATVSALSFCVPEELRIDAVGARQRQLVGEAGGSPVDGAVALRHACCASAQATYVLPVPAGPRAFLAKWC